MEKSYRETLEMTALLKSAEVYLNALDEPAQDEESRFWKKKAEEVAREVIEADGRSGVKGDPELWKRLIPALELPASVPSATGKG